MIIKFNSKELKEAREEMMRDITKKEVRIYLDQSMKRQVERYLDNYVEKTIKKELADRIRKTVAKELKMQTIKVEKITAKEIMANIDVKNIEKEAKKIVLEEIKNKMKNI